LGSRSTHGYRATRQTGPECARTSAIAGPLVSMHLFAKA
jgi:hypothetical protein